MIAESAGQSTIELIQIALTPVFLLVGIGTILNVVTGRVARIIDRARWYEECKARHDIKFTARMQKEISSLDRRLKLANWSINFLTASAVIVCMDIILLLMSGLVSFDLDRALLVMFVLSIAFITGGLVAFFLEVSVATATLKVPKNLRGTS